MKFHNKSRLLSVACTENAHSRIVLNFVDKVISKIFGLAGLGSFVSFGGFGNPLWTDGSPHKLQFGHRQYMSSIFTYVLRIPEKFTFSRAASENVVQFRDVILKMSFIGSYSGLARRCGSRVGPRTADRPGPVDLAPGDGVVIRRAVPGPAGNNHAR